MSLISKIQSLLTACNSTTGQSRTDLTAGVQDLVDGYGGGDIDFEGGSTIVKSFIVTIGANNCTTMTECGAYIVSLCNMDSSYSFTTIAIEKKSSYITREFGCAMGKSASPYTGILTPHAMRYVNTSFGLTVYSGSYDGFLVEGTKYLVILTKEEV